MSASEGDVTYDALELELDALADADGGQGLNGAVASDDEGAGSEDSEDPLPVQPPSSQAAAFYAGPSVKDIFTAKQKRFRFGKTAGKTLPEMVMVPLTSAYEAFARKDYKMATELLSLCAQLAPRLPDPHYTMALMHEERGNLKAATQLFLMAAILSSSKALKIWQKVVEMSIKVGELSQAELAVNRLMSRSPCYEYMCLRLQIFQQHMRDDKRSISLLKAIIQKYPEKDRIHVDYADMCFAVNIYDRALAHYLRYIYGVTGTALVDSSRLKHFKISVSRARHYFDITQLELLFRACARTADVLLEINTPLACKDCFAVTESVMQYTERIIEHRAVQNLDVPSIPVDIVLMNATARLSSKSAEDTLLACRLAIPLLDRWDARLKDESEGCILWYLYKQKLRFIATLISAGLLAQSISLLKAIRREQLVAKLGADFEYLLLVKVAELLLLCGECEASQDMIDAALLIDSDKVEAWIVVTALIKQRPFLLPAYFGQIDRREKNKIAQFTSYAHQAVDTTAEEEGASGDGIGEDVVAAASTVPSLQAFTLEQLNSELKMVFQWAMLRHQQEQDLETFVVVAFSLVTSLGIDVNASHALFPSSRIRFRKDISIHMSQLKSSTSMPIPGEDPIQSWVQALIRFVKVEEAIGSKDDLLQAATELGTYLLDAGAEEDLLHVRASALTLSRRPLRVTFAVDKTEVELSQQLGLGEPAVASGAEIRTVLRRRRGRGLGSANSGDVLFNSLLESAPTLAAAVDLFQSRSSDVAAANDLLKVYMDTRLLDDLSPLETMFPVLQLKTLNLESLPLTIMAANNAIYHRRYAQAMEKYLIAYRLDKEQPLTCLCLSAFIVFLSMHHTLHQSADGRHQVYGKGLAFLIKYAELRKGQQAKQSDVMSEKERLHSLCLQQEVWYNMGRSYHDVKLLHLAVAMYNKALAIAEDEPKVKTLPSHCTREAAHNLVVIYKSSKAINLALSIMQRHLSFP